MKKNEIAEGTDYAIVAAHHVEMRRGGGGVDLLQPAIRATVTGTAPDGAPIPAGVRWNARAAYTRATVVATLQEDGPKYGGITGSKGDTVYVEPRRILSTWEDYTAGKQAAKQAYVNAEKARRERAATKKTQAAEIDALVKKLGLKGLIEMSAYPDGSGSVRITNDPKAVIALLKRIEALEATS